MSFSISCSSCGKTFRNIRPELAGKKAKCKCGALVRLESKSTSKNAGVPLFDQDFSDLDAILEGAGDVAPLETAPTPRPQQQTKRQTKRENQSRARADVMTEMKQYGLHRHFTGGSPVLMFGGGIGKGKLYGKTAVERPCIATENPVSIMDLHATIFKAMGIAADTAIDVEQRPFYVTEDGKGKSVDALFG